MTENRLSDYLDHMQQAATRYFNQSIRMLGLLRNRQPTLLATST